LANKIDEQTAWSLLRAVPSGLADKTSPTRVHHDPNPDVWLQVNPSGHWETSHSLDGPANDLLGLYLPLQLSHDLVIGQIGQSLDGRIATKDGQSHYVTGPADIRRVHRLRALVDAVVVGASTVDADNPRLTVREVEGKNPVRVVLDPQGRLSPDRSIFCDGVARTLVARQAAGDQTVPTVEGDLLLLPESEPDLNTMSEGTNGFAPGVILEALRACGLRRILVEGGGVTVSRFLQSGTLTRLHICVAPILIGSGRHTLTLPPITSLDEALRPPFRLFHLDDDLLFDFDLG